MNRRRLLLGGGALLVGVLALVLWLQYAPIDARDVPLPEAPASPEPVAGPTPPARAPRMAPAPSPSPSPPPAEEPPETPGSPEPVPEPAPAGERTGMALFPPLGTKPIKRGIIVPEGFELPPGYVRHYQATDDGETLPAILMFHPDVADAPADRMVPAEKAPPGMPIQYLVPPGEEKKGG